MNPITLEIIVGAFIFCVVVYFLCKTNEEPKEKTIRFEIFILEGKDWVPSVTFNERHNAESLCSRLNKKGAVTKIISREL